MTQNSATEFSLETRDLIQLPFLYRVTVEGTDGGKSLIKVESHRICRWSLPSEMESHIWRQKWR